MAAPAGSPALRCHPLAFMALIARREGVPALYVGMLPALIAMGPSGAVYYGTYDALKSAHLRSEAARTGEACIDL